VATAPPESHLNLRVGASIERCEQSFDSCRFGAGPTCRVAASSRCEGAQPSGVLVLQRPLLIRDSSGETATPFVLRKGSQLHALPRTAPVAAAPSGSARSGRRWARLAKGGPGYPHPNTCRHSP
jgi:hypothetical protein